jgi:Spy/CpxP family protein refolding chaperone
MARRFIWMMLAAVSVAAPLAAHESHPPQGSRPGHEQRSSQDQRRWKWWMEPQSRQELRITDQQSAEIEQIFETTVPKLRAFWRELEAMEATLSQMIKDNVADVAAVAQQVEKVESLRAEYNKTRTVMLYRINRMLSPEQRVKVEAIRARREEQRRRPHE